ncbi:MAG: ATP-binding protein, partial [Planctomycetota bacterium]
ALLIPELGPAPDDTDWETLFEAIRCALVTISREKPAVIFLDNLQWADSATLELLALMAAVAEQEALLLLCAFRSDEVPRGHPVRRLRNELRRGHRLREIDVQPLTVAETTQLLAQLLGDQPAQSLVDLIYARTHGVPLFVEELAGALAGGGRLQATDRGLVLAADGTLPIPETIRDAMLLRLEGLSDLARQTLEVAAVAGPHFDIDLVAVLVGDETGLTELINRQLIDVAAQSEAAFRHALMQESVYDEIPWTRCRQLHRSLAARLAAADAPAALVAEHWLAGKEEDQARHALIAAARSSCELHAYRDAATAGQRALSLWPDEGEEAQKLALLDQLGHCAQLSGMLSAAARAWREAARIRNAAGETEAFAAVQRRLAGVHELQGAWDRALSAHEQAADAFAAAGDPAEAATDRLAMVAPLQSAGDYTTGLEILSKTVPEIEGANRLDLKARALGLKGVCAAKLGDIDTGREAAQAGLSLALRENLVSVAAEAYFRLGTVAEHSVNYPVALETYQTAHSYCENNDLSAMANLCLGCLAHVLRQAGEWQRAYAICQEIESSPEASHTITMVAVSCMGLLNAHWGLLQEARRQLTTVALSARKLDIAGLIFTTDWGLSMVAHYEGDAEAAARHSHELIADWERTEERHYVLAGLCWAATLFAGQKRATEVNVCADALSQIAALTGAPDALASLAYALGEVALLDGAAEQAARHFDQVVDLLAPLGTPYDHALAQWRAGVASAVAGERTTAIDHLFASYRTARRLGAKPLVEETTQVLLTLGEKVNERLGQRAAGRLKRGGLTRRQFEVLQLVAEGLTNQEIGQRLV